MQMSRRELIVAAVALGATTAYAGEPLSFHSRWKEVRERFPEGVASGEPHPDSVILWTRSKPPQKDTGGCLLLEVATEQSFVKTVVRKSVAPSKQAGGTCRVLVGGAPEKLQCANSEADNFRKRSRPRTLLGTQQKAWFLEQLATSKATWKIWANKFLANPDNAPHVKFMDMGGHGYAVVRASSERMDVEFVCIPRPLTDNDAPDGGSLRYRVVHSAQLWSPGSAPKLLRTHVQGDLELST